MDVILARRLVAHYTNLNDPLVFGAPDLSEEYHRRCRVIMQQQYNIAPERVESCSLSYSRFLDRIIRTTSDAIRRNKVAWLRCSAEERVDFLQPVVESVLSEADPLTVLHQKNVQSQELSQRLQALRRSERRQQSGA